MATKLLKRSYSSFTQQLLEAQRSFSSNVNDWGSWANFTRQLSIKTGGTISKFIPYDYQVSLINTIEANRNVCVLKSRQMGISECLLSYLLWRAVREPGFTAVVISKTQQDSSDLAVRLRRMALSLQDRCPEMDTDSKLEVSFRGLGNVKFLPGTARSARGVPSVSVLWVDETAFVDGIEDIYQSASPTQSLMGDKAKVIFNSTPNGKAGLFWEVWQDSQYEDSAWYPVELRWEMHPVYGAVANWAEKTRLEQGLTLAQFEQEYNLNFDETARNVFSEELIVKAERGQFKPPSTNGTYLIGIDPNFSGADYFACTVWDISSVPYCLVAQFHQNRTTTEYSLSHVYNLLAQYKPTSVYIEANSGGKVLVEEITRKQPGTKIVPVITTVTTKATNVSRLILLMEQEALLYPKASGLGDEMRTFMRDEKGRMNASSGKHDDLLLSSAVGLSEVVIPRKMNVGSVSWW